MYCVKETKYLFVEEILAIIHNYANSLSNTFVSLPKLPAITLLAVSQEVGHVNLGVRKAAVGALRPLSVVLALGVRAVAAVATLVALDLVLQEEVEPTPLTILAEVLHVKVISIAVREATFGKYLFVDYQLFESNTCNNT